MISVQNLRSGYGKTFTLKNLSFEIEAHLTILGANGSGKSTLAKALCGLLDYQGSVLINGRELNALPAIEIAKLIAYIPAQLDCYERYTSVEDFTLLGRFPYKPPFQDYSEDDRALAASVLNELQLSHLAKRNIHELSSGQQQLLLIAQAVAQQSTVLIFDEPTANLDPAHSAAFALTLKRLQKKHVTLLITHDLQLASYIDGPVLFLNDDATLFHSSGTTFFELENLQHCYGVEFIHDGLTVNYD